MKDLNKIRILVIGDVILDEYVEGTCTRLSPEAPIPILDKTKTWYRLGGASNVSKNIASLSAYVLQAGRVGNDIHGEFILEELEASKIDVTGIICDENIPTILKTRFVCDNHQLLRVDYEDKRSSEGTEVGEAILDYIRHCSDQYDAIIVSDYQKGIIYPTLARTVGEIAKKLNIITVVDTHSKNWDMFYGYTCITPNKKELEIAVGMKLESLYEIRCAAQSVRRNLNLQYLLVTLSEQGMLLITPEEEIHIPVAPVKVIDVTGCGDTAIAVFTTSLAAGYSALESAKLANKAAGLVVEKMGTASVTLEELFKGA
jgi:rfaE bifunctional protein kinase chain/domain